MRGTTHLLELEVLANGACFPAKTGIQAAQIKAEAHWLGCPRLSRTLQRETRPISQVIHISPIHLCLGEGIEQGVGRCCISLCKQAKARNLLWHGLLDPGHSNQAHTFASEGCTITEKLQR